MKITVVSRNDKHLAELTRMLRERNPADEVDIVAGSLDRLTGLSGSAVPDLLVLDQPSASGGDLDRVERLGSTYAGLSFILLSEQQDLEFMMAAMRAGVREVLPWPARADTLFPAVARIGEKLQNRSQLNGKVLAFLSCKGGSGATFIATNLGYGLASLENKRIALIDLNLQFGDASLFVSDHKPAATLADVALQIHRLDASLLASSMLAITPNFFVLAAPDDPVHANDVTPDHIDALLRLARRHYDFIILDVGCNLDAVSIRALDQADMIFPVLQTTLPYIRDGKRLLDLFRSLEYARDKIKVIVNRHLKNSDIRLRDLETACGTTVYLSVPNHYEAAAASVNQGVPVIKLAPSSPISKSLMAFARQLQGAEGANEEGWLARIFKRTGSAPRSEPVFEENQQWMQKS